MIFRSKIQQQEANAQVVDQEKEDQLFVATFFSGSDLSESWLIDSGSTYHMTHDKELFKELRSTEISKVKIGNGQHIAVNGKGITAITSCSSTKLISDVLYILEIHQILMIVGQLLEKGFKVHFEEKYYLIQDASGQEMFKVKMRGIF